MQHLDDSVIPTEHDPRVSPAAGPEDVRDD